jgi:hypothetical protein
MYAPFDPLLAEIERRLVGLNSHHLVSGLRRDLRNTVAHQPEANHAHLRRICGVVRRRWWRKVAAASGGRRVAIGAEAWRRYRGRTFLISVTAGAEKSRCG